MRKLFNNAKKFNKLVTILVVISAALTAGSVVLDLINKDKLSFFNVVAVISMLPMLAVDYLFIYFQYLNKSYLKDGKYYHYLAIILIMNMASYFTSSGNSFSNIAFHSLQQLVVVAFMLNASFRKGFVGILVGIIVAIFNFLQVDQVVWILDILVCAICITKNVTQMKSPLANSVVFTCGILILASVISALNVNYQLAHKYAHLIINFSSIFAVGYLEIVEDAKLANRKAEVREMITKWIDKPYQQLTIDELLRTGVCALKGVSIEDGEILKKTCGINTIADLASNQYFQLADEMVEKAKRELF